MSHRDRMIEMVHVELNQQTVALLKIQQRRLETEYAKVNKCVKLFSYDETILKAIAAQNAILEVI